jgi:hypothetical protein
MSVRKLPALDQRIETGPVQFGDDWPGVFIRGDNALWFAKCLEVALAELPARHDDEVGAVRPRQRSAVLLCRQHWMAAMSNIKVAGSIAGANRSARPTPPTLTASTSISAAA